jgi:four helix bundle protein
VQNYKDLKVWQKAMDLAQRIFEITETFPSAQKYVLATQMQRCALSVPSNIAEGRNRHSENDFIYHLNIARGSLAELETQIILSQRLAYLAQPEAAHLTDAANEIARMLYGLRDSLRPAETTKAATCNL